jgi:uncharacterized membrane protein
MSRKSKTHVPAPHPSEPYDHVGLERLIFFSDAVFAIAITLLALEIRLPAAEAELTDGQLLDSLLGLWRSYMAYVISFLVIGSFWLGHHRKFRWIRRYDRRLLLLNLLLLMVVAFLPFPTSVISEYGNQTATIFYALTMALAGVLSAALWWYAERAPQMIDPALDARRRRHELINPLLSAAIFLISCGIALIDSDLAKFSWLLIVFTSMYGHE